MSNNPSHPLISGAAFRSLCGTRIEREGITHDAAADPRLLFVESDIIPEALPFVRAAATPVAVISHNGDTGFGPQHTPLLDEPNVYAWFAQNPSTEHPKLTPLPIGIANPRWEHGHVPSFLAAMSRVKLKTQLVCAHFNVRTTDREQCQQLTGVAATALPLHAYLDSTAASYFALSPAGFGIDCHRTWEALYLRAIPILPRHLAFRQYPYPMIMIDSWAQYHELELSPELYASLWSGFDPTALYFDAFVDSWIRPKLKGMT